MTLYNSRRPLSRADLLDDRRVGLGRRRLAATERALDGVELVLDLLELQVLECRQAKHRKLCRPLQSHNP